MTGSSGRGISLRGRLTLTFGLVMLVTLLLASGAFVLILREYQRERDTARVAELIVPLTVQLRSLEALGASREEIVGYLERQSDDLELRLVLTDQRGWVLADTDEALTGRRLDFQAPVRTVGQRRVRQAVVEGQESEGTFLVAPSITQQRIDASVAPPRRGAGAAALDERVLGRQSGTLLAAAIPTQSLTEAWLELLPRLSIAAAASLGVSVAIAYLLAGSIARPLTRMTRAAEAMAEGRYEQRIPVSGGDEVARLASTFNEMARAVSSSQRTLRDFLANVSHDLRTPLTSIRGFSQALTDGTLTDPQAVPAAGQIINQEAERMSRLVEDLLYLSKVESGQLPLARKPLHLRELLERRVAAASPRAEERSVRLQLQPGLDSMVEGDSDGIERVIDNLLGNAIRHAPVGSSVDVLLLSDGDTARLTVRNPGDPIPPEEVSRIFERFYQVDKARSAGGSGLGLAITREIVQAHGGRCEVTSSAELGTEISVFLPLRAAATAPSRPYPQTGSPRSTAAGVVPLGSAGLPEA